MASLNRVILVGRLTRDPELRHTASGLAIATFTIAVDRRYKNQQGEKQTDFLRCKAWRQKAEFVSSYVTKGRLVAVEGSIETSEVVGQDGQKRYFTDIVCDNIETLDSARSQEGEGASYGGAQGGQAPAGGGYFPDGEIAAAPQQKQQSAAPQAPRTGAQAPAPANQGYGAQPTQQQPEPAYPADDYDDSDPFADE